MQHDMGNAAWWFQTSLFQLENWKKPLIIRDDTYLAGLQLEIYESPQSVTIDPTYLTKDQPNLG